MVARRRTDSAREVPRRAAAPARRAPPAGVPLNRALSKLGLLSRAEATRAIQSGLVRVDGRRVTDPWRRVTPERVRISIDGTPRHAARWRTILLNKPRGVVTTRRDPEGRPTIYDVLGPEGRDLVAVGRLDLATSGLLLLTTDTQLANWLTEPANSVQRVYLVTVRGRLSSEAIAHLEGVTVRKASGRETHLVVELRQGRHREIRRMFAAIGRDVTRLKRVRFGGLELGDLEPGRWRDVTREEVVALFPTATIRSSSAR
jgi:23S rRNA pseudouridine2605 synthase